MPVFAKHWLQRLCLGGAGVLISSFGPGQVHPEWQPILFWFGVALAIIATFIWPVIGFALKGRRRFPERHTAVLQELAAPLATVQEQAMTYGPRDLGKMTAAKTQAEELIGQIPYDHETVRTVRDFLQACAIVADAHNTADEMREARQDVVRVSPALFRYLHDGKSVDRRKIDLPHWMLDGDGKEPAKSKTISEHDYLGASGSAPPQQEQTFDEAWRENVSDRIPFVRLRDLAPSYGLDLDPHDPNSGNVAYKIEGALRQAAVDGDLEVKGRKYTGLVNDNAPLVAIPASHFEDYSFAHGFLHYEAANDKTHTGLIPKRLEELAGQVFFDLHLSLKGAKAVLRKVRDDEQG